MTDAKEWIRFSNRSDSELKLLRAKRFIRKGREMKEGSQRIIIIIMKTGAPSRLHVSCKPEKGFKGLTVRPGACSHSP